MNFQFLTLAAHVLFLWTMSASAAIRYVDANGNNPTAPYTNWTSAALTIQDAVDAAIAGDQILVTNGIYKIGGRVAFKPEATTNRVAVTKALMVRSVNGAAVTVIQGYRDPDPSNFDFSAGVRCVYLADGASLVGFTLTTGRAGAGGGVWCESSRAVVSNCVLTGNSASGGGSASDGTLNNCLLTGNSAKWGGGAAGCILNNCSLTGNRAFDVGGAAIDCALNNCTVCGNTAVNGIGGVIGGKINNCVVYYNTSSNESNYSDGTPVRYSCTTPLPPNEIGSFTNAPLFVDYTSGNLRLHPNSPCINAGANASAPAGPDLDGNPRLVGGTVDAGAYEFQTPRSLISYAWLHQHGLPNDGSADETDTDGDGFNNGQEWHAGTDPTSALSLLRLLSPAVEAPGVNVSWQSVSGRSYFLERSTDLRAQPPFVPVASGLAGQPGMTTFRDTNTVGAGPFFYRVGVQ